MKWTHQFVIVPIQFIFNDFSLNLLRDLTFIPFSVYWVSLILECKPLWNYFLNHKKIRINFDFFIWKKLIYWFITIFILIALLITYWLSPFDFSYYLNFGLLYPQLIHWDSSSSKLAHKDFYLWRLLNLHYYKDLI